MCRRHSNGGEDTSSMGSEVQNRKKTGEYFTNCSTAMSSFVKFWLLMKGSGVGRSYDSDLAIVNWDHCPNIRVVIDGMHPDFNGLGWSPCLRRVTSIQAIKIDTGGLRSKIVLRVGPRSSRFWRQRPTSKRTEINCLSLTSQKSGQGSPIKGQQGRPASGPAPFMNAVLKIGTVKNSGMAPWKQAMWIDHYLADTVALGGIRRSARIATKWWGDSDIFDFINIKRSGNLFTANNSVAVDDVFWKECTDPRTHAYRVLNAILGAQYLDNTGEPGILNLHNMSWDSTGVQYITPKTLVSPEMRVKDGFASENHGYV